MNKYEHANLLKSVAFFLLGVIYGVVQSELFNDYDKYRWMIIVSIIFPLLGIFFGLKNVVKSHKYWKLLSLLAVLINLGLAVVIFVTFSFSYWQF